MFSYWIKKAVFEEIDRVCYFAVTLGVLTSITLWLTVVEMGPSIGWDLIDQGVFAYLGNAAKESETAGPTAAFTSILLMVQVWATGMRLRHAGLPTWAAFGILLPKVNLFIALWAMLAKPKGEPRTTIREVAQRAVDSKGVLWRAVGMVAALAIGGVGFYLSVVVNGEYGWILFLLVPLVVGFVPAMCATIDGHKTLAQCCGVSFLTAGVGTAAFLVLGVEGMICIIMALPLAALPVFFGSALAYLLQFHPETENQNVPMLSSVLAFLPITIFASAQTAPEAQELVSVKTSITIEASPETVWKNIVAFNELDEPDELMFRAGVAYPIRAEIEGEGVGAVRHCVFSTGPFVEPITAWDEPRLLAFDVTKNPPTMDEMSPYEIHPKHLDGHFVSERGQFLLVDLGGSRTRVEGTTWYRQSFGPNAYWQLWSDHIIHTIHTRVLRHIKASSEGDSAAAH